MSKQDSIGRIFGCQTGFKDRTGLTLPLQTGHRSGPETKLARIIQLPDIRLDPRIYILSLRYLNEEKYDGLSMCSSVEFQLD